MWKNLKGFFVVEEEGRLEPKSRTAPVAKGKADLSASPESKAPASAAGEEATKESREGRVEERFIDVLLQAMERANLPGFDYLEYKRALENLEPMGLDDANRFKAAYAAAQSMDVTPKQLIDSANHYLRALQQEQEKFTKAMNGQRDAQVTQRQSHLQQLADSVTQQEAKIKRLEEEIARTRARQAQMLKTIGDSEARIFATAGDFRKTYETITDNIAADVAKMQEYLK